MNKRDKRQTFDPIQVEVWRHLLAAIPEEMGAVLERTAYSPNIKERLDYSCAIFDADGRLLAQAAHIPVHLGAMPLMIEALRPRVAWPPGVMWLCNDPRIGGTHLPDLTLVAPVYSEPTGIGSQLLGFVASRAHHADIGGLAPGSLPLSTEIFHEGLILPPVRLVENGEARDDILQLVCANSRTPSERRGDLSAQVGANETGMRRLRELVNTYGVQEFGRHTTENIAYAAEGIRNAIRSLPAGVFAASDVLDDDGAGRQNIRIAVTVTIKAEGRIRFDFAGSAPQASGSLNATEAITRSACYYVVRCLAEEEMPTNEGCFAPIDVVAPEGSIVNARFPAAVAGGNVETSQRIVDVVLKALANAAPDRIPAASQGTMNNVTIGGFDPVRGQPFAYYETIAGGAGASPQGAGASGIHTHMTNTRNTPVESLESHYPLRIEELSIAQEAGGIGFHAGGRGLLRRIALLCDAQISMLTDRRVHPPYGLRGGGVGALGLNKIDAGQGSETMLPGKFSASFPEGAVLTVRTPGGGGWGLPQKSETVAADTVAEDAEKS